MSDIVTKVDILDKNGALLNTAHRYCRHPILVLPRLLPIEINENGTYPVPHGFAGYGQIRVAVDPLKETSLLITENGTYQAPPGTVFTSVTVNVTDAVTGDHTCKYTTTVVPPTCSSVGYTRHVCTICGNTVLTDHLPALDHSYVNGACTVCGALDPNVTPDGDAYDFTLTVGETFTLVHSGETPSVEHPNFLSYIDNGTYLRFTATAAGTGEVRLSRNGSLLALYSVCVTAVASGGDTHIHTYTDTVKAPTCNDPGYTTHTCTVCGYSFRDSEKAALGHRYVAVVTAPTCTDGGYTTNTCSICGNSFINLHTAPLGHVFEDENGSRDTCRYCGAPKPEEPETPGDGGGDPDEGGTTTCTHSYTSTVTPATCTEGGYTTHTCSLCGHSYISDETDPNGHNLSGEWVTVTEPTCTAKGSQQTNCLNCGETVTRSIDPLGHTWRYYEDTNASSGWSRECTRCYEIEEDVSYDA